MIISLKKWIVPSIVLVFIGCLIIFSSTNLTAARDGLLLWANNVVPTLLPFLIATELLSRTSFVPMLGSLCNRFMRPLFNVPGEGAFALLMGWISGYPVGAKIVTNLYRSGLCTKSEANRMLGFTNNSGPLFIIGTVGVSLFYDARIGFLLLATHIFSGLLVGMITGMASRFSKSSSEIPPTRSTFSKVAPSASSEKETLLFPIGECISSAIQTILMIGGFVMLFSVLISICMRSHVFTLLGNLLAPLLSLFSIDTHFAIPIWSGILELTNGVKLLSCIPSQAISINITLCAFLLGFGGLSVALQVYGIIASSGLSIKPYLFSKLLQGGIAAVLTYFTMHHFRFFNWDIQTVFSPATSPVVTFSSGESSFLFALFGIIALCIIGLWMGKKEVN